MLLLMGEGEIYTGVGKQWDATGNFHRIIKIGQKPIAPVIVPDNWHPLNSAADELRFYIMGIQKYHTMKFVQVVWEVPSNVEDATTSEVLTSYSISTGLGNKVLPYLCILRKLAEQGCLCESSVSVFSRVPPQGTLGQSLVRSVLQGWVSLALQGTGSKLQYHSDLVISVHPTDYWVTKIYKESFDGR